MPAARVAFVYIRVALVPADVNSAAVPNKLLLLKTLNCFCSR